MSAVSQSLISALVSGFQDSGASEAAVCNGFQKAFRKVGIGGGHFAAVKNQGIGLNPQRNIFIFGAVPQKSKDFFGVCGIQIQHGSLKIPVLECNCHPALPGMEKTGEL